MTKHISQLLPVALKEIERNMETNKLLQDTILNTIINNVDCVDVNGVLEYDTVETAASYIAEEIREIPFAFLQFLSENYTFQIDGGRILDPYGYILDNNILFNDFVNQRYGTKEK